MAIQFLPTTKPEDWKLTDVNVLLQNIMTIAFLIAGTVAIIYIIIGGYSYLTAYGNEERASAAKKTITWAIVGLIVIILSKFIVTYVLSFFSTSTVPTL